MRHEWNFLMGRLCCTLYPAFVIGYTRNFFEFDSPVDFRSSSIGLRMLHSK